MGLHLLLLVIAGIVREMEAVRAVADAWPARRGACTAQASAAAEAALVNASRDSASSPHATNSVSSPVTSPADDAAGSAATLAWLSSFNMEGKVLQQLISLKPRIAASTCSGIFSGMSGHWIAAVHGIVTTPVPAQELRTVGQACIAVLHHYGRQTGAQGGQNITATCCKCNSHTYSYSCHGTSTNYCLQHCTGLLAEVHLSPSAMTPPCLSAAFILIQV